ncbi:MarR family winged helix-turn-helix transcriptional regulator [Lutibaculum baratangense]|uniref:HTH-type transcriptional regulator PetP n=1 Tax=Lutibaculum baratangense AMV1 TaxID=631454 RepID=V4RAJ9_9HYPH|nr:MarR family transcriptional regulator [Lutibaculum baratangense]ESR23206.1 HTH-type transcriptional regulator PetP [Lutibaculum baratangense AMV1]
MTDINIAGSGALQRAGTADGEGAADEVDQELMQLVELLFFAYRDFIGDPDAILDEYGFGRAHHRVLHFVSRNPGLRVADLLDILKITKQSLGRVLKQLVDEGFIYQEAGRSDRRQRLLYPTPAGAALASRLARPQLERFKRAVASAGLQDSEAAQRFLMCVVNPQERQRVAALMRGGQGKAREDDA